MFSALKVTDKPDSAHYSQRQTTGSSSSSCNSSLNESIFNIAVKGEHSVNIDQGLNSSSNTNNCPLVKENNYSNLPSHDASSVISDLPSSFIKFALLKLSSSNLNSPKSGLSMTVTNDSPHEQFTSSSKLSPCIIPFEQYPPHIKRSFIRQRIIEEIVDTEESYISSLYMLSDVYLKSIILKGNDGIPIKQLNQYVNNLVKCHFDFLIELKQLINFQSSASTALPPNSPQTAGRVADLISKRAINKFFYEQFFTLHDLVFKLINSKESDPELGLSLTKGFQTVLEAASSSNGMDLSLNSLMCKPIARISKYKLFLETLLKSTPKIDDNIANDIIQKSIIKIDNQISEINRFGLQEKLKANVLFNSLKFQSQIKLNFPVEYLGMPILLGSLFGVYINGKDRTAVNEVYGCFLFKTHLILTNVSKYNKFDVKFLIPLSICQIYSTDSNLDVDLNDGGIYTRFKNSFKLKFENNFKLFEILLISIDKFEYDIWFEKLNLLINFINGPYKLDYSISKINKDFNLNFNISIIKPNLMQCFDIKLSNNSILLSKEVLKACYFNEIIPIRIAINYEDGMDSYNSLKGSEQDGTDFNIDGERVILINEVERSRIEYLLQSLWSDELLSKNLLVRREQSVSKSKSKRSSSFRFTFKRKSNDNDTNSFDILKRDTVHDAADRNHHHHISLIRKTSKVLGFRSKSTSSLDLQSL